MIWKKNHAHTSQQFDDCHIFLHLFHSFRNYLVRLTCALFSSSITSFFSLLISQTHMNSTSLFPVKNSFLIFWTTAEADLPRGTGQFSISQNTPIGSVSDTTEPWDGEPVNEVLIPKAAYKKTRTLLH